MVSVLYGASLGFIPTGPGGMGNFKSMQLISSPSSMYRFVSYPGIVTNANPLPPAPNSIYNAWGGSYNPQLPGTSRPTQNVWGSPILPNTQGPSNLQILPNVPGSWLH